MLGFLDPHGEHLHLIHTKHLSLNCIVHTLLQFFYCVCRFYQILKDYCGTLNEESIHSNFVLIHELLNEYMVSLVFLLVFEDIIFSDL